MYTMGNQFSLSTYHFEDIQKQIQNNDPNVIILNTMDKSQQQCLICGTLSIEDEIEKINMLMKKRQNATIIIYGKNHCDQTVYKKYIQLSKTHHLKCFMYMGGLFEWLLLQEIYGCELFPTHGNEFDLLKYR
mgnify:CR=1 FL=1